MKLAIKKGDKVKVHFVGKLDSGEVFDSSEKSGKPLEVTVGSKELIPGFDSALVGMEKDGKKEITLKPEEAFGSRRPELVQKIPKEQLKIGKEPQPGMQLTVGLPNMQQFPAKITDVTDKEVTIDLNHPLADKTLHFKINVVDVNY